MENMRIAWAGIELDIGPVQRKPKGKYSVAMARACVCLREQVPIIPS